MRHLLALLLFGLFATAASATQTFFIDAPKAGGLNLRTGPSTGYAVIREMPHGSRVTLLARPGKWVRLRHESGAVGWAHGRYLSAQRPRSPAPDDAALPRLYVNAPHHDGLNLRAGPGTGYKVLRLMRHGSRLDLLGENGQWRLLRHRSGQIGWAHSRFLSPHRPRQYPQPGFVHAPHVPHLQSCRGLNGPAYQICRARRMAEAARHR